MLNLYLRVGVGMGRGGSWQVLAEEKTSNGSWLLRDDRLTAGAETQLLLIQLCVKARRHKGDAPADASCAGKGRAKWM